MAGDRLTRTELSWLLTQEAKSAAEKLRKGVRLSQIPTAPEGVTRPSSIPPSMGHVPQVVFTGEDTGVEHVLNRLDETMSMLASLYGGQPRGRRGKIDVAALLWEIAPEARVQIDMGNFGLVVYADENELRRMLHVLMALGGDPTTHGSVEVSVKREGDNIRIAVELGPDSNQGFESESQWLNRMATRYGGRFSLEGKYNTLILPASEEQREVEALRRELAAAQAQGEAYARELALIVSKGDATPLGKNKRPSFPPSHEDGLASLVGVARSLVTDVRGILAAIGREIAPLRERGAGDPVIIEVAGSIGRHVTAASEVVSDLARLAGCPLHEQPSVCDVSELVKDVVKAEQARAFRHGVTLHFEAQTGEDVRFTGLADEWLFPCETLSVLVQHLVDAAITASPVNSSVEIALSETTTTLSLTIDDAGPPLSAKARATAHARNFDTLVQERASALPLIAAFAIAAHIGASLTLEESPRGGVRVTAALSLPS